MTSSIFGNIPKIVLFEIFTPRQRNPQELHAHLNGSLSEKTLDILLEMKNDPILASLRPERHIIDTKNFKIDEYAIKI